MLSTVLSSLLSIGFSAAATRIYSVHTLALNSALVASIMPISMICGLSFNNLILRFLPRVYHRIGIRVPQAYRLAARPSLLVPLGTARDH